MATVSDIKALFGSASSFELAALVLQGAAEPLCWAVAPSKAVCYAFAVEAYYKVLISIEGGEYPANEHHLLTLHECCSDASQKRLEREWWADNVEYLQRLRKNPEWDADVPRNLRSALSLAAKAFIDFRYRDSPRPMNFQLRNAGALQRRIILEKRPDLRQPAPSPFLLLNPEP